MGGHFHEEADITCERLAVLLSFMHFDLFPAKTSLISESYTYIFTMSFQIKSQVYVTDEL